MKTMTKISAFVCFALFLCSCGANESILKSGKKTPEPVNAAPQKAPVQQELDAMRTAGFDFVYALRRVDSDKIDASDRSFVKELTADANRRVVTEDEMYIVIGTNTVLSQETMDALLTRFAVGTFPKSRAPGTDTNSNANK
jgi:hypothetical protein